MISEVSVKNFKCFEKFQLPLTNVNILAGVNGMGKSTVIQALLLMRQSFQRGGGMKNLYLNGEYVSLGNGQDILYEKAEEEWIELGYKEPEGKNSWTFQYLPGSDSLPVIQSCQEAVKESGLLGGGFTYLSA